MDAPRYSIDPTEDERFSSVNRIFENKPPVLSMLGNVELLDKPGIGFCGSRKASEKGLEIASECAWQVAESGLNVVSGYAAGVDLRSHHAALEAGGSTIIVLPEGIDRFRIKRDLKNVWDWERVLIVSQFLDAAIWRSYRAMERNKTIIALSAAMIVVEAGDTGGTLNAGLETLKFKLPLFAVNFGDANPEAKGNAILIEKGAQRLSRSRITGNPSLAPLFDAVHMKGADKVDQKSFAFG